MKKSKKTFQTGGDSLRLYCVTVLRVNPKHNQTGNGTSNTLFSTYTNKINFSFRLLSIPFYYKIAQTNYSFFYNRKDVVGVCYEFVFLASK